MEDYVRNCAFAKDHSIDADPTEIICESYKEKSGNQRYFSGSNRLELVVGSNYYQNKRKMFDAVVGFAKFSEYLVVAEVSILSSVPWYHDSPSSSYFQRNDHWHCKSHWMAFTSLLVNSLRVCTQRLTYVIYGFFWSCITYPKPGLHYSRI